MGVNVDCESNLSVSLASEGEAGSSLSSADESTSQTAQSIFKESDLVSKPKQPSSALGHVKVLAGHRKARDLASLLSESEEFLAEMLENKGIFCNADGKVDKDLIYFYVNGLIDQKGNFIDVVTKGQFDVYLQDIMNSAAKKEITVTCQNPQMNEYFREGMPLERLLEKNEEQIETLSMTHWEFINKMLTDNRLLIRSYVKSIEEDLDLLRDELDERQDRFFVQCVQAAQKQNMILSGFIHLRKYPLHIGDRRLEQVYVKFNPEFVGKLAPLLVKQLYDGEDLGVVDIKFAGPLLAGRTDGIVIYIGDDRGGKQVDSRTRRSANLKREAVVQVLKGIQREYPECFSKDRMPLKKREAAGIATIPGLSSSSSFTSYLSRAIAGALPESKNVKEFMRSISGRYLSN